MDFRKSVFIVAALLSALCLRAQDSTALFVPDSAFAAQEGEAVKKAMRIISPRKDIPYRHSLKLGIGDMYTDAVAFPDSPRRSYAFLPSSYTFTEQQSHRYCPHLFVEYSFRITGKISVGFQTDFFSFSWKDVSYSGGSDTPTLEQSQWCTNWAFMPQAAWMWAESGSWSFYSTLRGGLALNTGSQTDTYGRKTVLGYALSPTVFGVSYDVDRFFFSAEVGAHFALHDNFAIFSALSKLFTFSAGIRL